MILAVAHLNWLEFAGGVLAIFVWVNVLSCRRINRRRDDSPLREKVRLP